MFVSSSVECVNWKVNLVNDSPVSRVPAPTHSAGTSRGWAIGIEPELRRVGLLGTIQAERPKADVVALAWTAVDRLLEAYVLLAAKEVERAERCRRVRPIEDERQGHSPGTFEAERIGNDPAGACKG